MENICISKLYYRYKKISDEKIAEKLKDIKIVIETNKGNGTMQGYYPLTQEMITKISEKPRKLSLTFDCTETEDKPVIGLKEWKEVVYLVKSTSRFFLKPDVGEIFDQIEFRDLYRDKIKAICFRSGSETLEGTDGEHFLMQATLLVDEKETLN